MRTPLEDIVEFERNLELELKAEHVVRPPGSSLDVIAEYKRRPEASPVTTGNRSTNIPRWMAGAITAKELQAKQFDPVRFVLPGIIPEGVTLLVGKPKLGKSWAAL